VLRRVQSIGTGRIFEVGRRATLDGDGMAEPAHLARETIAFGPFTLLVSERLLKRDGEPVRLGARALDTLIALVSRSNRPVDKRELIAEVWPDAIVAEGSLRFHIASLRKALGDGENGQRYISTLGGRGYCFVAPIMRSSDDVDVRAPVALEYPRANVPSPLLRMVGRDAGVFSLSEQLVAVRFITIVGAGGVGKTTVAVAVAHYLNETFAGGVLFVDLAALNDPRLAAQSVASVLGLPVQLDDPTRSVVAFLRDKRLLLVLDNCEHLIEAAAALAEQIFVAAPQVHILATSREALRVEGEHVHRLQPLAFPSEGETVTAVTALSYPAVQLFIERVEASGIRLTLSDQDAAIVAKICRKLDGTALAIALVAGRVEALGLSQTAELLDERLPWQWRGRRTAPPRQQTLKAMLDWSYELLTDLDRLVLRRLGIFTGDFTLGAALSVVTSASVDQILVLGAIANLVGKSLVSTNRDGATMRYRLLDTTRAYVLAVRMDPEEFAELATRHAAYYRHWLEKPLPDPAIVPNGAEGLPSLTDVSNVRSALEWCFGPNGDANIGIGLAAVAASFFLAMSLMTECYRWSERAVHALDGAGRGEGNEMHLQAALGLSLMFTRGSTEEARTAFHRGLAIAEERGDARVQLQVLSMLHMFYGRIGESLTALHQARRCLEVASRIGDAAALTLGHSLLGMSLHFTGDLNGARAELEAALRHGPGSQLTSTAYLGFNGHILVGGALARTLWLQGHPAQAAERARRTVKDAAATNHPVTLSIALIWAISVFFWTGDLDNADDHIDWFMSRAESYSLGPYRAVGQGFKGQLAIRRGDPKGGIERLRSCLADLHVARYELLTTPFNMSLVQGLSAEGQFSEAMSLIDRTIRLVQANGDLCYMAELLRIKGNALIEMQPSSEREAELCFRESHHDGFSGLDRRPGTARDRICPSAADLRAIHRGR
jgi:predicted ATPase/DNA-binding winged helix-turn-helix (wHTH) protein